MKQSIRPSHWCGSLGTELPKRECRKRVNALDLRGKSLESCLEEQKWATNITIQRSLARSPGVALREKWVCFASRTQALLCANYSSDLQSLASQTKAIPRKPTTYEHTTVTLIYSGDFLVCLCVVQETFWLLRREASHIER